MQTRLAGQIGTLIVTLLSISALAKTPESYTSVRHRLVDNIYETAYVVTTGPGPHDQIRVHRVVQEERGQPIPSSSAVFFTHGDVWGFNGAFLGGTANPASLPVYLARRGVDVWGIDFAWTLVPADTTDFSFMRNWGLQHDVNDLETAIRFARIVRQQTGSDGGRIVLLGWSRGGWTGYALLNQETQEPCSQSQVRAFISVDNLFKTNDSTSQSNFCSFLGSYQHQIAAGVYAANNTIFSQVGDLAITDPNGASPLFGPPYSNLQVSLTIGAATFQLGPSYTPYYHFVGGIFPNDDITGIPSGLTYTTVTRWNDFLISASPFEPLQLLADASAITCSSSPGTFDDHLGSVTVPVLYVGAGGGIGAYGLYTLSLLGSNDIQSHIVSFYPPAQQAFDFAHVDLFNAGNAGDLAWAPIHRWLARHRDDSCER